MKYDFTSIIDRNGKDAIAVELLGAGGSAPDKPKDGFDAIPMWVADMNFPAPSCITDAIIKRANHPTFGYFHPRKEYFDAIINWQKNHNGVIVEEKNIGYENGVLGGVVSAINVFCSKGDNVLVHSPTYIGFTHCMKNAGYNLIHSELKKDSDGVWRMDFSDMEKKIVEGKIHAAIFCSPHNPCGRVWEKWEIEKVMELFKKHDVFVVSDEIWSDLIMAGHKHIPTQSISDDAKNRTVAFYAPSKTFNLAGLVGSYRIAYNKWIIDRIEKEQSLSHYNNMNVLSMHALIGAFSKDGEEWLSELLQVLGENINYACDFINENFNKNFSGVEVFKPQGTYMLFLDCTKYCERTGKNIGEIIKAGWDVGVAWQDGRAFNGNCHIRMNLAVPHSRVQEAFERLKKYVFVES